METRLNCPDHLTKIAVTDMITIIRKPGLTERFAIALLVLKSPRCEINHMLKKLFIATCLKGNALILLENRQIITYQLSMLSLVFHLLFSRLIELLLFLLAAWEPCTLK